MSLQEMMSGLGTLRGALGNAGNAIQDQKNQAMLEREHGWRSEQAARARETHEWNQKTYKTTEWGRANEQILQYRMDEMDFASDNKENIENKAKKPPTDAEYMRVGVHKADVEAARQLFNQNYRQYMSSALGNSKQFDKAIEKKLFNEQLAPRITVISSTLSALPGTTNENDRVRLMTRLATAGGELLDFASDPNHSVHVTYNPEKDQYTIDTYERDENGDPILDKPIETTTKSGPQFVRTALQYVKSLSLQDGAAKESIVAMYTHAGKIAETNANNTRNPDAVLGPDGQQIGEVYTIKKLGGAQSKMFVPYHPDGTPQDVQEYTNHDWGNFLLETGITTINTTAAVRLREQLAQIERNLWVSTGTKLPPVVKQRVAEQLAVGAKAEDIIALLTNQYKSEDGRLKALLPELRSIFTTTLKNTAPLQKQLLEIDPTVDLREVIFTMAALAHSKEQYQELMDALPGHVEAAIDHWTAADAGSVATRNLYGNNLKTFLLDHLQNQAFAARTNVANLKFPGGPAEPGGPAKVDDGNSTMPGEGSDKISDFETTLSNIENSNNLETLRQFEQKLAAIDKDTNTGSWRGAVKKQFPDGATTQETAAFHKVYKQQRQDHKKLQQATAKRIKELEKQDKQKKNQTLQQEYKGNLSPHPKLGDTSTKK